VSDNTGLPIAFNSAVSPNTERLILRPWREADRAEFARLNDDPAVMEFMPKRLSRDESDALALRIEQHIARVGWGLWAVEVKGVAPFIGYVGLAVPRFHAHFLPAVEIGWRLAREHWGRGYATEAAAATLRLAFDELNLQQLVAFTVPLNKRSIAVMERIGMTRDRNGDFEHPNLAVGHPLRHHVLYRIGRADWLRRQTLA
jgi:ribosomal-protein-alanine N-acetyltransferase